MNSMTQEAQRVVIGGVDAHADAHHYAAQDGVGALLGAKAFPATTPGYAEALRWLRRFGAVDAVDAIAVESTGSYAAGLVRYRDRAARNHRPADRPDQAVRLDAPPRR